MTWSKRTWPSPPARDGAAPIRVVPAGQSMRMPLLAEVYEVNWKAVVRPGTAASRPMSEVRAMVGLLPVTGPGGASRSTGSVRPPGNGVRVLVCTHNAGRARDKRVGPVPAPAAGVAGTTVVR